MKADSPGNSAAVPRDDKHDVIIVPSSGPTTRLEVNRDTGRYPSKPNDFPVTAPGGRKARTLTNASLSAGPALAIAPTRPEPAAQNGTCIIVNQQNVQIRNSWTAARLNNEPDGENDPFAAPIAEQDAFDLLIAGPGGRVYEVTKTPGQAPTIQELQNLGLEGELWHQLRNGFVAGSVRCFQRDNQIRPMVNVMALIRTPSPGAETPAATQGSTK